MLAGVTASAQDATPPKASDVGKATFQAFKHDLAAIRSYAFTRTVTRTRLNRHGALKEKEVLVMRVTPDEDGFTETLIEIDGSDPTEDQVEEHREAETFERHYEQMIAGQVEMPILADLELQDLLETFHFTYESDESIQGKNCHRYTVDPADPPKDASKSKRIAAASEGTIWLAQDTASLVRMETRIVRPLKTFGFGMNDLDLTLQSTSVGNDWLLSRIEIKAVYEIPFKVRRHNTWVYTDFENVQSP